MELRQLRYFRSIARTGSFSAAAADEFVVQSALSQQIRKLEEELGVKLFERTTRMVRLTREGEQLLEPADRARALPSASIPGNQSRCALVDVGARPAAVDDDIDVRGPDAGIAA